VANAEDLVGKWMSDPGEVESIRNYGRVSLDFSDKGTLVYAIHASGKKEFIFLTWRVEGDVLVTDQPSAPKQERTKFSIDPGGKLSLLYADRRSVFVRDFTSGTHKDTTR
jgi:hypothetical protein